MSETKVQQDRGQQQILYCLSSIESAVAKQPGHIPGLFIHLVGNDAKLPVDLLFLAQTGDNLHRLDILIEIAVQLTQLTAVNPVVFSRLALEVPKE